MMSGSKTCMTLFLCLFGTACTAGSSGEDSGVDPSDETGNSGDAGNGNGNDTDEGSDELVAEDYRGPGPHSVGTSTQTVTADSCSMDITLYSPEGDTDAPLVLLSHGFARGQNNMAGWAEHYASWGFTVATPSLCHASLWDADHSANADDLIALGRALTDDGVIYAGQSAGGLASLLAAGRDDDAIGVLGLDATDAESLGLSEADRIEAPVYGLAGEASECNASNNGLDIYARIDQAEVLRVTEADHCDFESDTDLLCTTFCEGSNGQFEDGEIRDAILGLSTGALHALMGNTAASRDWWSESGPYYGELATTGIISVP